MKKRTHNTMRLFGHRRFVVEWAILFGICGLEAHYASGQVLPSAPVTRQDNVKERVHGVEIVDPYRWLEHQESPETRQWIELQGRYSHSLLDRLPLRERIQRRLTELVQVDRLRAPIERNGRYFFSKRRATDDLSILYLRKGMSAEDEVLIDPHTMSSDHTVDIALEDISNDGKLLVYGMRRGGEDETELRVMDIDSRTDLSDRFPRALYRGVSLKREKEGFYYALQKRGTGSRIYFHTMGKDAGEDTEVFGEGYGPDTWVNASVSEDGRYLLLNAQHGWARNEIYVQNIAEGKQIVQIVKDIDAHFNPWFAGDSLIMQTDWQAPSGRILSVDLANPSVNQWREIVPPGPDAITDFSLVGGRLVVHYLHNVTSRLVVYSVAGKMLNEIALPGLCTASGLSGRWGSNELFFDIASFTIPHRTLRYDMSTGEADVWSKDDVPFSSEQFEVQQFWYPSKDGTNIPMFLVHRKGLKLDGSCATLLYGYGGFNVSITPSFRSMAAMWLERGGIFAVANIRGGGEFGEAWHRAGMLNNKQNVFDDFIAAAEWLIAKKYTNSSKLAIWGGSNGGLLVGAALTQRPDLYQAVLCEFPDLDMVGYYRFENNNPPALLEYGNASDPEQFKFLYAYSPYQRVRQGTKYPAVLLTTGDADTRVPPLQARKMTARLQSATASGKPILLLYDTKAGHAGGRPQKKIIEDLSLELAFLFWQLGVEWQ